MEESRKRVMGTNDELLARQVVLMPQISSQRGDGEAVSVRGLGGAR